MARTGKFTRIVYYGIVFVFLACAYHVVTRSPSTENRPISDVGLSQIAKATLSVSRPEQDRQYIARLSTKKKPEQARSDSVLKKTKKAKSTKKEPEQARSDSVLKKSKKAKSIRASTSTQKTTPPPVCNRSWKTNWDAIERGRKPVITLDPERFLYPLLVNGPNNQLIGLRDALYLAIRLNRTFILPRFYKHKTDTTITNGSSAFIPPSQRIDVAALADLVHVLPFSAIQHTCKDGFDDLYFTSYKGMHFSLPHIAEEVGVPIHTKQSGEPANVYPVNAETSFNAMHIPSDKKFLRKLYGSPGKCALYVAPFRTVGVKESPDMLRKTRKRYLDENGVQLFDSVDTNVIPDQELYSLIVHCTHKPKHISTIVNDFMVEYGLNDMLYLSVHWRYDPLDWQIRCRKDKKNLAKRKEFLVEMCNKVYHTEPIDISRAILKFIRKLELASSSQVKAIYFAAPLNMAEFVEGVETEMNSVLEEEGAVEELHIFTQSNLHEHLLKYSSCEGLKENYEDVFSQLEMEVCSRAIAFLRSPSSSWSKVIKERRVNLIEKYDGNIFELAWKAAEKRLNE